MKTLLKEIDKALEAKDLQISMLQYELERMKKELKEKDKF